MIRMAVIGRGWIVDRWIGAARKHKDFELAATYSRDSEGAKEFAQKHGAPLYFDSLEALAECDAVDGVYIASPVLMHAKQTMAMLRAGKHVFIEKPITACYANAVKMFETAEEKGVILMEGMRNIHTDYLKTIKGNLSKLGKLRKARFSYCQYSSKFEAYKAGLMPNTFNAALGNGALMDLGVYLVESMVYLFGEPSAVCGQNTFLDDWEANGTLLADYGDLKVELSYSKISNSAIPSEIQGEKGTMVIEHIADGGRLYIRYNDGTVEELEGCEHGIFMESEAHDFFEMVKGGQPTDRWKYYTLTTAKVMEEARKLMGIRFPDYVYEI